MRVKKQLKSDQIPEFGDFGGGGDCFAGASRDEMYEDSVDSILLPPPFFTTTAAAAAAARESCKAIDKWGIGCGRALAKTRLVQHQSQNGSSS